MNVTRQSSKRASPNLFLFLVLTEAIAENALSTLAVATGKIKQYQLKKRVNHMPRSRRSADPAQQHFRSAAANRPLATRNQTAADAQDREGGPSRTRRPKDEAEGWTSGQQRQWLVVPTGCCSRNPMPTGRAEPHVKLLRCYQQSRIVKLLRCYACVRTFVRADPMVS